MESREDPFNEKLNSFSAGALTLMTDLFLAITIAEQAFSHQPWTFHRITTVFGLVAAAFLVFAQWYALQKFFKRLKADLLTLPAAAETRSGLSSALWAGLTGLRSLAPVTAFVVTMAFRSILEH